MSLRMEQESNYQGVISFRTKVKCKLDHVRDSAIQELRWGRGDEVSWWDKGTLSTCVQWRPHNWESCSKSCLTEEGVPTSSEASRRGQDAAKRRTTHSIRATKSIRPRVTKICTTEKNISIRTLAITEHCLNLRRQVWAERKACVSDSSQYHPLATLTDLFQGR